MNLLLILAGAIGLFGGWAHLYLGERWTIGPLRAEVLDSYKFKGEVNKRIVRWFWHIGSMVLLSTSALLLAHGLGWIQVHRQLLLFISFQWLSITALWVLFAGKPPTRFFTIFPGLIGIPVNLLILAGSWP